MRPIWYQNTYWGFRNPSAARYTAQRRWPPHNRDTISCSLGHPGVGNFPRKLNVTSTRAGIRQRQADIGASGWMVGADPKQHDRAGQVMSPDASQYLRIPGSHRWRWIALLAGFV